MRLCSHGYVTQCQNHRAIAAMKSIAKLRICDWSLIVLTTGALFSGIQLELLSGSSYFWIWVHIGLSLLFLGICIWHIQLHFKSSNWFIRFKNLKSHVTKMLWWISLFTLATGMAASLDWLASGVHGPIGAIHGKIGFLMILLVVGHIVKRMKFFFPH